MAVIMFSPPMAKLVRTGVKRMTIREREIKVGTPLSLREWSGGKAYARGSSQISILETKCVLSSVIQIYRTEKTKSIVIKVGMVAMNGGERRDMAMKDGFASVGEFVKWFEDLYGLPFQGWITGW